MTGRILLPAVAAGLILAGATMVAVALLPWLGDEVLGGGDPGLWVGVGLTIVLAIVHTIVLPELRPAVARRAVAPAARRDVAAARGVGAVPRQGGRGTAPQLPRYPIAAGRVPTGCKPAGAHITRPAVSYTPGRAVAGAAPRLAAPATTLVLPAVTP